MKKEIMINKQIAQEIMAGDAGFLEVARNNVFALNAKRKKPVVHQ